MQRTDSFEKTLLLERLKAGREGDDRGWAGWMATPTPWTWVWVSSWSGDKQGSLACCNLCGCKESDTTQRLNWSNVEDIYTANRGLILIQFLLPSSDANEHARCLLTKLSVSIQEGLGIPPCSWSLLEAREIYDATLLIMWCTSQLSLGCCYCQKEGKTARLPASHIRRKRGKW